MPKTITFGNAMPEDEYVHGNVRMYVLPDGRMYLGIDTDENVHVCDMDCADAVLAETDDAWQAIDRTTYVAPDNADGKGNVPTADIGGADYGDDPYVLCGACGAELHRDDDAYEAMYGTTIDR